jgi:MFS family permease
LSKSEFGSPTAYGAAVAALAAGSLLGALLAGVWKIPRRGLLILLASALLGACLMLIALVHGLAQTMALLLAMGVVAGVVNVHIGAWIMQRIDASVRGRVSSVLMLASLGVAPISLAIAGFAVMWSVAGMFVLAGALMLLATAAAALHDQVRAIR